MTNYTSAPWRLWTAHTPENPDEYPPPGEGDRRIVGADNICIGVLFGGFSSLPELEHNHALIAAAPDLLTELKDILDWALVEKAPLRAQEIAHIRTAIAKAEGK